MEHSLSLCRTAARLGLCMVCAALIGACATTGAGVAKTGATPSSKVLDERAARKSVEQARQSIEGGDPYLMIPRLQDVIARYRGTEAAGEAYYWLGVTYYRIGGYRDAIDAFEEYLRTAPEGQFAKESNEYVAKLTEEYNDQFISPEELDAEIDGVRAKANREPGTLSHQWELADLLWKRGNYDEAGRLYVAVAAKQPEYAQDATFKNRIELLPNNQYVILTPAEILRRNTESQPLSVINEATFRSGRDLFTRESRHYVVTGQVVNRGESVLYGVQVIVTIYGFGNVVFDTNTVNIGRLNPKEIRAFSVRFSNFDDINNIFRHECVGTFQR